VGVLLTASGKAQLGSSHLVTSSDSVDEPLLFAVENLAATDQQQALHLVRTIYLFERRVNAYY
jgi:hypothetical protein